MLQNATDFIRKLKYVSSSKRREIIQSVLQGVGIGGEGQRFYWI
jgi:hypothetical protein